MNLRSLFNSSAASMPAVSVTEAKRKLDSGEAIVVDVREPNEWRQGHIAGATLMPLSTLSSGFGSLPKDREVLLICQSGNRSGVAQGFLARSGFSSAINVQGGMIAWQRHGLPMKAGK